MIGVASGCGRMSRRYPKRLKSLIVSNVLAGAMSGEEESERILRREVERLADLLKEKDRLIDSQRGELVTLRSTAEGVNREESERLAVVNQHLVEEIESHRSELEVCASSLREARKEYDSLVDKCQSRRSMLSVPMEAEAGAVGGGEGSSGEGGEVSNDPVHTPAQTPAPQDPAPSGRQELSKDDMLGMLFTWMDKMVDDKTTQRTQAAIVPSPNISGTWPKLLGQRPEYDGSQEPGKFVHIESFIKDLEFCMSGAAWTDQQKVESGMLSLRGEVLKYEDIGLQ